MEVYIVKPLSGRPLTNTLDKSEISVRLVSILGSNHNEHLTTTLMFTIQKSDLFILFFRFHYVCLTLTYPSIIIV